MYVLARDIVMIVIVSAVGLVVITGAICICVCMLKALKETWQEKKR